MKFAYADPPYLGCGNLYAAHHADALAWNDPATHQGLIDRLCADYPDGWALSLHVPSLRVLLPMCPDDVRIGCWCKSFGSFKPGVNPAYVWEPVIWRGGRKHDRSEPTARDFLVEPITLQRGLTGAKPRAFARWVFDLLGARKGDTLDDLFPGTGGVTAAWHEWTLNQDALPLLPLEMGAA